MRRDVFIVISLSFLVLYINGVITFYYLRSYHVLLSKELIDLG